MNSVRSKILASILLITIVVAFGITMVIYRGAAKMIEQNYITVFSQRQEQTINAIDQMVQKLSYISIDVACNTEIKEAVSEYRATLKEKLLEEISENLRAFKKTDDGISSIYLLLPKERTVITSREYPVYRRKLSKKLLGQISQEISEQCRLILISDFVYDNKLILSLLERIENDKGEIIGYIFVNIENRKLYYDYLATITENNVKNAMLLKESQVITSLDMDVVKEHIIVNKYVKWMQGQENVGSDSENIYIYYKGNYSKLGLFLCIDRRKILGNLVYIRNSLTGVMILFLLISLIPAFYLTRVVYRPLKELTHTIKHVSYGELGIRARIISKDEIGSLSAEFNQMLDRIEELIQQVVEQEMQKKDAELEALQYQITPHFMYNTLNSIKCAAMLHGEKELAKLLDDFVELLQASISKRGTFLTVAEEIYVLKKYLELQNFRYGGGLTVIYEVEDSVRQCIIPRLLLQPLVENALLHGLDIKDKNSYITIRMYKKDDKLYLEVKDNGQGITKEQIQELLNSKTKKKRGLTAIGVANIKERLSLYYGDEAGLFYESSSNGTKAVIYIPIVMDAGE